MLAIDAAAGPLKLYMNEAVVAWLPWAGCLKIYARQVQQDWDFVLWKLPYFLKSGDTWNITSACNG